MDRWDRHGHEQVLRFVMTGLHSRDDDAGVAGGMSMIWRWVCFSLIMIPGTGEIDGSRWLSFPISRFETSSENTSPSVLMFFQR